MAGGTVRTSRAGSSGATAPSGPHEDLSGRDRATLRDPRPRRPYRPHPLLAATAHSRHLGRPGAAGGSPRGQGPMASSRSRRLSSSTGSPIACRRRGSTGIAITESSRRITGCGKPSRRWRKGNIGKRPDAATGEHGGDGHGTGGCCGHSVREPGPIRPTGCRAFRETRSGRPGRSSRGSRVAHRPEDRCGSAIDRAIPNDRRALPE
jgi:hypothetical protein